VSYKIRNSIALGVLLLLVLGIGGYISFIYQPGKINKYKKEAAAIESQLKDNTLQTSAITGAQDKLRGQSTGGITGQRKSGCRIFLRGRTDTSATSSTKAASSV